MSDIQQHMQNCLDDAVRTGREQGIQLAVYVDGKLVVDAWAGTADDAGTPVHGDTLFPVFSVTKGFAATLAHLMAERGKISYDTSVADVWPEFAAHGKSKIQFKHILGHSSGLPYMPLGIGYHEINNWRMMCNAIADMNPVWPAGEQVMYHAVTFSWLVGEVIQRVSGQSFAEFLKQEISIPLGVTNNLFVGIPDSVEPRVALLNEIFDPGKEPHVDDTRPQAIPGWLQPLHTMMNRPDTRRACIPASNGIMTARALAKHYAALLPGGVDGVELLPPERIRQATRLTVPTGNMPSPLRMSLGYILGEGSTDAYVTSFGHGGYGGSNGFADPTHRLAVGLTKNLFSSKSAHGDILAQLKKELNMV